MNAAASRSRNPLTKREAPNLLRPNRRARWRTGTSPTRKPRQCASAGMKRWNSP